MRLHRWLLRSMALGFMTFSGLLAAAPGASAAPPLPKVCVDAGISSQPECDALLKSDKNKGQRTKNDTSGAPAKLTINAPAAAIVTKATPVGPANNGLADQKPPTLHLAPDCEAAGLTSKAECDALHARTKALTLNKPPTANLAPVTTPPKIAPVTAAPAIGAVAEPRLPKLCLAAGIQTQAACDAFRAANAHKGKPGNALTPSGVLPLAASPSAPLVNAVTSPVIHLPKECVDAGLKTQADCDAFRAANLKKGQLTTPPGKGPSPLIVAPGTLVKAPSVTPPGGQLLEVVPTLPKGVTKSQVAPLLDSVKQVTLGKGQAPVLPATGAISNAPPPADDKAAQLALGPLKIAPINQQKGQTIDFKGKPPAILLPQNVTIINQTVVNTTVNNNTNNTTNIVQNNNGPPNPPNRFTAGQPANPIGLSLGLVLQIGNQMFINSSGRDQFRIAYGDHDRTDYERLPQGRYRETITRPDGVRIVTIYDSNGDILRRSRFDPDGHEIVLAYFDDSHDQDLQNWRDPGDDLPPLHLTIPVNEYVLDADQADEGQVQQFFAQPPVEQVQRLYSIDEVKRSARLRDMVRRLEIGDLTFDTGQATIAQDQVGALSNVANAMLALLQQNPAETFLIEGHTDAVGSDVSNLQLSDARAATVAGILTDFYHIPPENLATQGYGAEFLKVQTLGPERLNRRVVIRRITPLVTVANQGY